MVKITVYVLFTLSLVLDITSLELEQCPPGYRCRQVTIRRFLRSITPQIHKQLDIQICDAGTYSPGGSDHCTPCAKGTYAAKSGAPACYECPKGHMCSQTNAVPEQCPIGTYNNLTRQTCCLSCPSGKFALFKGMFQCDDCPSGHRCPASVKLSCENESTTTTKLSSTSTTTTTTTTSSTTSTTTPTTTTSSTTSTTTITTTTSSTTSTTTTTTTKSSTTSTTTPTTTTSSTTSTTTTTTTKSSTTSTTTTTTTKSSTTSTTTPTTTTSSTTGTTTTTTTKSSTTSTTTTTTTKSSTTSTTAPTTTTSSTTGTTTTTTTKSSTTSTTTPTTTTSSTTSTTTTTTTKSSTTSTTTTTTTKSSTTSTTTPITTTSSTTSTLTPTTTKSSTTSTTTPTTTTSSTTGTTTTTTTKSSTTSTTTPTTTTSSTTSTTTITTTTSSTISTSTTTPSSIITPNCPNGFTLINFDELDGSQSPITSGYYGLNWPNISTLNPLGHLNNSGYSIALSSGQIVAFNAFGYPASITVRNVSLVETFSIKSFVAAAAWNNDLQLLLTGERSGTTIYTKQIILQTNSTLIVSLDWNNIDKITFTTSGGVAAGLMNTHGLQFAMDNLCLSTRSKARRDLLYKCDYWGDSQLIKFPKVANENVTSTWCNIEGPSILYENSYVLINVMNSGSERNDIITDFNVTFYNADRIPLCTLTPSDVLGNARSCGPDIVINKTASHLNVAYKAVPFSAWINFRPFGGGNYVFTLFTTLAHINDVNTNGMCVKGCHTMRSIPELVVTNSTTDKEIVTSAIAADVCNTFIRQVMEQLPGSDLISETTPGYIDAVRKACIIDVTITGNAQFAEDSIRNVITDILTHKGEVKVEELNNIIQDTAEIVQQLTDIAEKQVETIIEASTWPCQSNVPICVSPSSKRRR